VATAGGGRRVIAAVAVLVLPVLAIAVNFRQGDQRHNYLVRDYTDAMFASLEPDAVILTRQWDAFCSPAIYEQLARRHRPDVTVVEKELLRRTWYLEQLPRWDAQLTAPCEERMTALGDALIPFETGGRFDAQLLQRLYIQVIHCLLESAETDGRPIYLTPDARTGEQNLATHYLSIPVGLTMRLYREPPDSLPEAVLPVVRGLEAAASSDQAMPSQLAGLVLEMLTRRAILEASRGETELALRLLREKVLAVDPGYARALNLLGRLENTESEEGR
jgi:hypothetical protein